MRDPHAPALRKSVVLVATALCLAVGLTSRAAAQAKFDRLFVFGDSYADLTLSDRPASSPLAPPGLALDLWRVYPLPLAEHLGIKESLITDVAVGGATADPKLGGKPNPNIAPGIPSPPNLPEQVQAFLATNPSFGVRDLVTINIGGNDIRGILFNTPSQNLALGYPAVITPANAKDFADKTTEFATQQIGLLHDAGARNFVLGGFSSISALPTLQDSLKGQPPAVVDFVSKSADAYAKAYFEGVQTQLTPLANAGSRFFLFDLARLGAKVNEDPAKFGFVEFRCPPPTPVCGGSIRSAQQDQYYFGPDGLHLTNAGFALVAAYMGNIVMAPDTIAVQPGIVTSTTSTFTGSVLGRLDAMRGQREAADYVAGTAVGGQMGLGLGDGPRRRPPGPPSRLTAYAIGTFVGGTRSDSFEQVGFDFEAPSGTVGLEYSVNRNLIVGVAGNYTASNADLNGGASIDVDTLQAAAYISYATPQLFAEALVAFGHHDLDLARPGVLDPVRSSTDANSFAAAARGAYLFDLGNLRAGPIAGLTYIRSRVDGYTETGDELLTFNVSAQTMESLVGNVGVQFRTQFLAGGNLVSPFVNITLEHQFGDNTHTMTANLTQAPLLPILTSVPNFEARTYGRVEGGLTLQMGPDVSATVNAASTFARDEGNDWRISTGLNYRF
jgi:outer membrane lipase/esterase